LALTATADKQTIEAMKRSLWIHSPTIVRGPLFRGNLYLSVSVKADCSMQLAQLQETLHSSETLCVVFCNRTRACEDLRKRMQNKLPSWRFAAFHSDMCTHERESTLQQCRDKHIYVVFGTTAFGLGIDIIVRTVLHWDVPQSLCQYVQDI
jgi:superfamily II DNA helicase RecQ